MHRLLEGTFNDNQWHFHLKEHIDYEKNYVSCGSEGALEYEALMI